MLTDYNERQQVQSYSFSNMTPEDIYETDPEIEEVPEVKREQLEKQSKMFAQESKSLA